MKKLILFCLFTMMLSTLSSAQMGQLNRFYHQHRHDKGVINVTIPGWMLRWGGKIARKHTKDEPAAQAVLKMVKKLKTMRMMVIPEGNTFPAASYAKMTKKLKKRQRFEELITIRAEGNQINVMSRGRKDKLKGLLFLINAEDAFVMLNMKTKLKIEDLTEVINEIIKMERKEKEEEVKEEPVIVGPQA